MVLCYIYADIISQIKLFLYLSKEMAEKHHKYNPYGYCIDKLAELQNRHIDVEYIERNELTKSARI